MLLPLFCSHPSSFPTLCSPFWSKCSPESIDHIEWLDSLPGHFYCFSLFFLFYASSLCSFSEVNSWSLNHNWEYRFLCCWYQWLSIHSSSYFWIIWYSSSFVSSSAENGALLILFPSSAASGYKGGHHSIYSQILSSECLHSSVSNVISSIHPPIEE